MKRLLIFLFLLSSCAEESYNSHEIIQSTFDQLPISIKSDVKKYGATVEIEEHFSESMYDFIEGYDYDDEYFLVTFPYHGSFTSDTYGIVVDKETFDIVGYENLE